MIFEYKQFSNPEDIYNNPHDRRCEFCNEKLNVVHLGCYSKGLKSFSMMSMVKD